MKYFKLLFVPLFIFAFLGCEEKSKIARGEVHWDRDMCARCVMVVSDRKNTTQVVNPETGKNHMFDDIGCMALWFEEEKISWKDKAIVWITDVNSGEWIDAKKAFYTDGNVTPMAFGFSAHKTKSTIKKDQKVFSYSEVINKILGTGK